MREDRAKSVEKLIYTTTHPNNPVHNCAVAFTEEIAVSFEHLVHSSMKEGDKLTLYNVNDPSLETKVVVFSVQAAHDLIVFKTIDSTFPLDLFFTSPLPRIAFPYLGQKYFSVGANKERNIIWKDGVISQRGYGCLIGTSYGENGDSGSGLFSDDGYFLGVSVAKKHLTFENLGLPLHDVADHHPYTKIIPSDIIMAFVPTKPDPAYDMSRRH